MLPDTGSASNNDRNQARARVDSGVLQWQWLRDGRGDTWVHALITQLGRMCSHGGDGSTSVQ